MTTQDIVTHLRTLHGYTDLDAKRAVRDTLDVLRHMLDELDADEGLTLPGIGRWLCRVKAKHGGGHGLVVAWNNSRQLSQGLASRTLPADDPRVVKAMKKKRSSQWRAWYANGESEV